MSSRPDVVNVYSWIEENNNYFLPPVCNKLMHFSQLNVMFVGGPNAREDYHIEEGEELFFQLKGDMCLKVIENGNRRDVLIREGEILLLPARIPHSPQRQANTVGLVIERRRLLTEFDCLRFYLDNTTTVLFEKWFYCQDLRTQLVPLIKEFKAFKQDKRGNADPGESDRRAPYQMSSMNVMSPFSFKDWLDRHSSSLANGGPIDMFGAQFETEVIIFGCGQTEATVRQSEVWIWQMEGSSTLTMAQQEFALSAGDSLLIPEQTQYQWQRDERTVALFVVQDPERKRP
ncbi:3-hydroxyanthranilate 3,4-dioxygenase [Brachionichthys hirsutus]|uniref:3-hydroxyanthranilate 3,4-dioxygenase n=1 Tax=Brachionichthys hirsutus TaxID=412623 RepID=UPI00360444E5